FSPSIFFFVLISPSIFLICYFIWKRQVNSFTRPSFPTRQSSTSTNTAVSSRPSLPQFLPQPPSSLFCFFQFHGHHSRRLAV
ncbi:unnamed protein product, partial [Brassica oleracea]